MLAAAELRPLFSDYAATHRPTGELGAVVDLLRAGTLTRSTFDLVAARCQDPDQTRAFREALLDLVLFAAERYTADHRLPRGEADALRVLTVTFRIPEGEFAAKRPEALGILLQREMTRLATDGQLDGSESAYLDALQAAFRLGYDDFMTLAGGSLTDDERRALRLP